MKVDLKKPGERYSPPASKPAATRGPVNWEPVNKESLNKDTAKNPPAQNTVNKEITIKVNPRKIGKGLLMVLLLLGVFFLGRLSVPGTFSTSSDFNLVGTTSSPGPSSAATLEEVSQESVETVEEVVEEAPVVEVAAAEESSAPPEEAAAEAVEEEPVITEYTNAVALAIDSVDVEWKETWGKIMSVTYTIKNGEAGAIKPHHFTMMVEGYSEDDIASFEVPYTSQKIGSTVSKLDSAIVYNKETKGFSYSPKQVVDLKEVEIKLFLWDGANNIIAQTKKNVDLSG